jgi:hypothetical protein
LNTIDDDFEAQQDLDDEPRRGEIERTDIEADEVLDGDVDAAGAAVIRHRNE